MTRMEQRLLDPAAGGAIAAAREFGIDLSLLVERLRAFQLAPGFNNFYNITSTIF